MYGRCVFNSAQQLYMFFFCFLKIGLTQRDFTQGLSVSLAFCNGRRLQLPGLCVNHLKCSLEFNDNFWLYGNLSYYKVWWPLLAKNVNNPFPDIVKTYFVLSVGFTRYCTKVSENNAKSNAGCMLNLLGLKTGANVTKYKVCCTRNIYWDFFSLTLNV